MILGYHPKEFTITSGQVAVNKRHGSTAKFNIYKIDGFQLHFFNRDLIGSSQVIKHSAIGQ
jgi:hypothetical protein